MISVRCSTFHCSELFVKGHSKYESTNQPLGPEKVWNARKHINYMQLIKQIQKHLDTEQAASNIVTDVNKKNIAITDVPSPLRNAGDREVWSERSERTRARTARINCSNSEHNKKRGET